MSFEQLAVRFVDRDEGIIAGIIVPFTGPLPGNQDLYGTRFSRDTDLALDWFPDGGRPGLYQHGFDETLEAEVIGREIRSWEDDKGRWLEAQLDKAHRYADEIMQLVDGGKLSLSSGAVDHLVRINSSTRDVERWPWVEWSLTPNPGNPEALTYHVRSMDAVKHVPEVAIRIVEDLDALVPKDEEPEPTPTVDDMVGSVRSLLSSMQPDALHALACEMGASCTVPEPSEDVQPEPTVTITSSAEAERMLSDEQFETLRQELQTRAIDQAKDLTK